MKLINKWTAMQAVQGIDSVATLRDGDPVIRMSAVEHVLENLPEAPDINVGNMDTTTHDSIPAKTGKNDGNGTSGDCISRQMAIDALRAMQTYKLFAGDDMLLIDQAGAQTELMMLPPAEPDIIRCKDCEWWTKQENSIQGRCALHKMYPSGNWYCGTARRRGEQE